MNLKELRSMVTTFFASGRTPSVARSHRSAEQVRDDRASSVTKLRAEVRQLQQEISDASDAGDTTAAAEARVATLHRQLEQKQAELATFQARV